MFPRQRHGRLVPRRLAGLEVPDAGKPLAGRLAAPGPRSGAGPAPGARGREPSLRVSRPRQTPSLDLPPADLGGFPSRPLSAATPLFRVVRKGRNPWWFGSAMTGRFDLTEPDGTCYLASDPVSAILELIGPDIESGAVSSDFFRERRLRELRVPEEIELSDLTSRRASGFGITSEIGSLVPYTIPQAWAARLRAEGSGGV